MPNNFSRNSLKVNDVYNKFANETLIVDNSYQRRKVWGVKDNVRLIETILLDLVIPEIFLWDYETDPNTGKTITHIVDGQQRINAIFEFISDNFRLQEKYLIDKTISSQFGNKLFSELPDPVKRKMWVYELSIVQLNSSFNIEQVRNMFYRLNLTDYSLNEQEKRNSLNSFFGKISEELADNDFWSKYKIFSPRDIRRMQDIEYCSGILMLCREGIVDQTKPEKLNLMYTDFVDEYKDSERDKEKIYKAMLLVDELSSDETTAFTNKKVQMYTMFCVAFDFIDNNTEISDLRKGLFIQFVKAYNAFKNEYELVFDEPSETKAYEMIKKYKLASSEGVNKLNNRMIRFEIIKKILIQSENIKLGDLKAVEEKSMVFYQENN